MLLCDIGNTNIHFYKSGQIWNEKADIKNIPSEKFYYISVNEKLTVYLSKIDHAIDISTYFFLDTIYRGMGIDRIAACYAVHNGIIVDAGSAITVDIMANGIHLGGYIMPGLLSLQESFKRISPKLDMIIDPHVSLEMMPQNTREAISYGVMKPIIMMLKETKKDKKIYFTGGDGKFFAKFFPDSVYDGGLVFKGMLKAIRERGIRC